MSRMSRQQCESGITLLCGPNRCDDCDTAPPTTPADVLMKGGRVLSGRVPCRDLLPCDWHHPVPSAPRAG